MSQSNTLIELNNVYFKYKKDAQNILKNINFSLHKSDYTAIVGTSGSGKSTLLSILGLINQPTEGQCLVLNHDVRELTNCSISKLKTYELGFIYQNFNLLNHMKVQDNIALPLTYNKEIKRVDYKAKVIEALEIVGMAEYISHYPTELSGGQQQRVAIARALVNDPSILFADEPTGNLDSQNSKVIYDLFDQLNKLGKTICLITHDHTHAELAKTRWKMLDGELTSYE